MLGTRNLAEILAERESISKVMQDSLDEATDEWGVKVGQRAENIPSQTRKSLKKTSKSLFKGEQKTILLCI